MLNISPDSRYIIVQNPTLVNRRSAHPNPDRSPHRVRNLAPGANAATMPEMPTAYPACAFDRAASPHVDTRAGALYSEAMPILPCQHPDRLIRQIKPTRELLSNLNTRHPDLLKAEGIIPQDYLDGMVFRSAIESIRGTFAATTSPRAEFTSRLLERMKAAGLISDWQSIGGRGRCDYNIIMPKATGELRVAVESKGGEGNSFNIGDRPNWSNEYVIWGHLDGAIVHQPAHGAASNLFTRLSAEIVANGKQVDAYVVLDRFCGTRIRPCPKMPAGSVGQTPPPCVFLLPRGVPTADDPSPRLARLNEVKFINAMLDLSGVKDADRDTHVKRVGIKIYRLEDRKGSSSYKTVPMRRVTVYQGSDVLEQKDLRITRGEHIFHDAPRLREGPGS